LKVTSKAATKILVAVAFVFIAVVAFLIWDTRQEGHPPKKQLPVRPVKTMVLKESSKIITRTFPGKVQASQQVNLSFRVSGPLVQFPVKEGQKVQKGDIVARIDPRDYETNLAKVKTAIAETQAKLEAMKTGARPEDLNVLESEVSASRAILQEAEQQFERYQRLYQRGLVPKADYDRYRANYDVARAQLNAAIKNLEKGKKGARKEDIEAMESNIKGLEIQQKEAQNALNDTYLHAPFSGRIAKKYVENFQEVRAQEPIVSLQDLSSIEVAINVPEGLVTTAKKSDPMEVVAEFAGAPGKQHELIFKEASTEADRQTQTYRAVLVMPAPRGINIFPGMTATVVIKTKKVTDGMPPAFLVPVHAVFADEANRQYVWVLDRETMRVKRREVAVGRLTGESIRVVKGLAPGATIVTAGVNYLHEDMKVLVFTGKIGD